MIPQVPADAVRAAVAEGDWATAAALISEHDRAVRVAAAAGELDRVAIIALLDEQRMLEAEMALARDDVAQRLRQLFVDRRGFNAYLGSGA